MPAGELTVYVIPPGQLKNHRVALTNQLRAHLKLTFPGAVGLFADLDSAISLRF